MGAVPGMLNLTHMGDQFSHFLHIQCSSNHHLQAKEKKKLILSFFHLPADTDQSSTSAIIANSLQGIKNKKHL